MTAQIHWDPFTDLQNTMDRLFDQGFARPWRLLERESVASFPIDLWESEDAVHVRAALPGVRPEDVNISTSGDTVTIKTEVTAETSTDVTYLVRELSSGPYNRSISMPMPIDADKAEASFEHGMLHLKLPKADYLRPRQIKIQSGSHS